MKHKIILSLLLSVFILFLTSCLSLFSRSVESFEKEFIAELEKYITSEDYYAYYKTYKEKIPSMEVDEWSPLGSRELSSEEKNMNQAIENVLKMEKYKHYYDFAYTFILERNELTKLLDDRYTSMENYIKEYINLNKILETDSSTFVRSVVENILKDKKYLDKYSKYATSIINKHHTEIQNGYKKLDKYMSSESYMEYIDEFEHILSEKKSLDNFLVQIKNGDGNSLITIDKKNI